MLPRRRRWTRIFMDIQSVVALDALGSSNVADVRAAQIKTGSRASPVPGGESGEAGRPNPSAGARPGGESSGQVLAGPVNRLSDAPDVPGPATFRLASHTQLWSKTIPGGEPIPPIFLARSATFRLRGVSRSNRYLAARG